MSVKIRLQRIGKKMLHSGVLLQPIHAKSVMAHF